MHWERLVLIFVERAEKKWEDQKLHNGDKEMKNPAVMQDVFLMEVIAKEVCTKLTPYT